MKQELFEMPTVSVIQFETEDILTSSSGVVLPPDMWEEEARSDA